MKENELIFNLSLVVLSEQLNKDVKGRPDLYVEKQGRYSCRIMGVESC
jgi:hypothetical protein